MPHAIIYTTEAGGPMQVFWARPEQFDEILAEGRLRVNPEAHVAQYVEPFYLALVRVERDYDRFLGGPRWTAGR